MLPWSQDSDIESSRSYATESQSGSCATSRICSLCKFHSGSISHSLFHSAADSQAALGFENCRDQSGSKNALTELGMTTSEPGLMRSYLEKRVPLGDLKTLQYLGTMAAYGWETGYRSGNRELQAQAVF